MQTLPQPGEGELPQHPPIPWFYQPVGCAALHCLADFWQGSKQSKTSSQRGAGKEVFNEKHCSPLWFCEQSGTKLINELFKGRHFVQVKKHEKRKPNREEAVVGCRETCLQCSNRIHLVWKEFKPPQLPPLYHGQGQLPLDQCSTKPHPAWPWALSGMG